MRLTGLALVPERCYKGVRQQRHHVGPPQVAVAASGVAGGTRARRHPRRGEVGGLWRHPALHARPRHAGLHRTCEPIIII